MKYNLIIAFVFCSCSLLIGQSNYYGSLEATSTTKGIFAHPSVGYSFQNIKLQIGVLIGNDYVEREVVFGTQGDILYYPKKDNKKEAFNFFFIGSINYFRKNFSIETSEINTNFVQGTVGYGFTYRVLKKLSIKNNMGLGVLLENRNLNFDSKEPNNKFNYAGIFSIGLIYKI